MAPDGVEDADYESDPEELKRSLATRRREASDDEEEGVKDDKRPDIDSEDSYDEEEEEEDDDDVADNDKTEPEEDATEVVEGEGEKKKEPFAVPTAGAFYMHDDRFQELDAVSNRRMRGGRRLWQSRDERKWGHDKYEEMNTHDKQYHRRTPRGRGRGRAQDRGYSRGSNPKENTSNGHQNQFPKAVSRGRGTKRYVVASRNGNQPPSAQTKKSQNSFVRVSQADSGRTETATTETETIQAKKNVVASSLNSASPPFYPSGASNNLPQRDLQASMGRLHINENSTPPGKKFGNTKSTASLVRTTQPSQTTSRGRGAPPPVIWGMPKGTDQTFDQHSAVISLLPSAPLQIGSPKSQYLSGEIEATETGALVAKGEGTLQPSGRGSLMYGGTQFMGPAGSMSAGHGNPNFPAYPPLMQFGGQHGGVPTFGMALPGYVQPEHGTGNPEMTWLFAGPGALGTSYCPPYAAIDGSYQAHKPGLPSSAGSSSQEINSNNPNDEDKPMERPEVTNNGTSQRSNSITNKHPRRYSEMSFSK